MIGNIINSYIASTYYRIRHLVLYGNHKWCIHVCSFIIMINIWLRVGLLDKPCLPAPAPTFTLLYSHTYAHTWAHKHVHSCTRTHTMAHREVSKNHQVIFTLPIYIFSPLLGFSASRAVTWALTTFYLFRQILQDA